MDINQLNRLGITSQLPWVDHPYYLNGQLHRSQITNNQYQTTSGWAAQIVGAPGVTSLPASNLGGDIVGFMPHQNHRFSAPGFAPGYGPDKRKKKKKGSFNPLAEISEPEFEADEGTRAQHRKMDSSLVDMQDAQNSAYASQHMKSAEFRALSLIHI